MPKTFAEPFWIGDHFFSIDDIGQIKATTAQFSHVVARNRLAKILCDVLDWKAPTSKPRIDSCIKLLTAMDRAGVIHLPKKASVEFAVFFEDRCGSSCFR